MCRHFLSTNTSCNRKSKGVDLRTVLNFYPQTGTLAECYDELGSRYQLPVFVLSHPTNLDEAEDEEEAGDTSQMDIVRLASPATTASGCEPQATEPTAATSPTNPATDISTGSVGAMATPMMEAIITPSHSSHSSSPMGLLALFYCGRLHLPRKRRHPHRTNRAKKKRYQSCCK